METKSIAINLNNRGCAFAVTTRSGDASFRDSVSGGGVLSQAKCANNQKWKNTRQIGHARRINIRVNPQRYRPYLTYGLVHTATRAWGQYTAPYCPFGLWLIINLSSRR